MKEKQQQGANWLPAAALHVSHLPTVPVASWSIQFFPVRVIHSASVFTPMEPSRVVTTHSHARVCHANHPCPSRVASANGARVVMEHSIHPCAGHSQRECVHTNGTFTCCHGAFACTCVSCIEHSCVCPIAMMYASVSSFAANGAGQASLRTQAGRGCLDADRWGQDRSKRGTGDTMDNS